MGCIWFNIACKHNLVFAAGRLVVVATRPADHGYIWSSSAALRHDPLLYPIFMVSWPLFYGTELLRNTKRQDTPTTPHPPAKKTHTHPSK